MNHVHIDNEDGFLTIEVKHSGYIVAVSYPSESSAWEGEYESAYQRFDDVSYDWDDCDWDRLNERISSDCRHFMWMTREDAMSRRESMQSRRENLRWDEFAILSALNEFIN